jgi:hypothetical protein
MASMQASTTGSASASAPSTIPNIILSMNKEDEGKKDEFMERLSTLLKENNIKVHSRIGADGKEEYVTADMSCWHTDDCYPCYFDEDHLPTYFKGVDDMTNYRGRAFNHHLDNININHVAFDLMNGMKYKNETLKKVYQKICEVNASEDNPLYWYPNGEQQVSGTYHHWKNQLFEDAFKTITENGGNLEIVVTTEDDLEKEREKMERKRGAGATYQRPERPEGWVNPVVKIYKIGFGGEEEATENKVQTIKRMLYRTLMKNKYHVDHIDDVLDFSKWKGQNGTNSLVMKTLKYYFDNMVDDDMIRFKYYLVHTNKSMDDITSFYESDGMWYDQEQIEMMLANAEKKPESRVNRFYTKLFKLFIEYKIIIKIMKA